MRRIVSSVLVVVLAVQVCSAAPPKKKAPAKVLSEGDEVAIFIVGDEAKKEPKLDRVGFVRPGAFVLPVQLLGDGGADLYFNERALSAYTQPFTSVDRRGLEEAIRDGFAIEVKGLTRASVVLRNGFMKKQTTTMLGLWPTNPGGYCCIRLLDGPAVGKIVMVPLRNLTEVPPAAAK